MSYQGVAGGSGYAPNRMGSLALHEDPPMPPAGTGPPLDDYDEYNGTHLARIPNSKYVPFDLNKGRTMCSPNLVRARLNTYLDMYLDSESDSRIGCLFRYTMDIPIHGTSNRFITLRDIGHLAAWMLLKPSQSLPCNHIPADLWLKDWIKKAYKSRDQELRHEFAMDLRAIFHKSGQLIRSDKAKDGSITSRSRGVHDGDNIVVIQQFQIQDPASNQHGLRVAGQGLMKQVLELFKKSFTSPQFQEHFPVSGPTALLLEPGVLRDDRILAFWNTRIPPEIVAIKDRDDWVVNQLKLMYRKNRFELFADGAAVETSKGVCDHKTVMGQRMHLTAAINGQPFGTVSRLNCIFVVDSGESHQRTTSQAARVRTPLPRRNTYSRSISTNNQGRPAENDRVEDTIEVRHFVQPIAHPSSSSSSQQSASRPQAASRPRNSGQALINSLDDDDDDDEDDNFVPQRRPKKATAKPRKSSHAGQKRKRKSRGGDDSDDDGGDWRPAKKPKKKKNKEAAAEAPAAAGKCTRSNSVPVVAASQVWRDRSLATWNTWEKKVAVPAN